MDKKVVIIVSLCTFIGIMLYFGFQAANSSPANPPSGNNFSGGVDICLGKQCEGKKALLEAAALATINASSWTPIPFTPVPTQNPVFNDTYTEVVPVLGWGSTGLFLLFGAVAVIGFAWWLFFVWLPNQKKKPIPAKVGKLSSLTFPALGDKTVVKDENTVGGTHVLSPNDAPLRLEVDPDVAINADTNAAMRDAAIKVGLNLNRKQLFNDAAGQMNNLLGTGLKGAASFRAAGKKPDQVVITKPVKKSFFNKKK